jgi:hypothetical protein
MSQPSYFNQQAGEPNLRDYQHARKLHTDGDLRLAPKTKFLYHVVFNINSTALKGLNFKYKHSNEISMLVKGADLPKFTLQTETLNQYNRKKVVQVKVDYNPINIRFHDDNFGVVGQLWYNYFHYYYGDTSAADISSAYNRNATLSKSFTKGQFGLDNGSGIPFFTSIDIYQLAKKAWYKYKIVNPVITQWNHDTLDSSSSQPSEQSMTLAYESVGYETGVIRNGNPQGFGIEHYDQTPSPYASNPNFRRSASSPVALGGGTSIFGTGGILSSISGIIDAVGGGALNSPAGFLATAAAAVNTYQNVKSLTKAGAVSQLTNAAAGGLNRVINQGISGQQQFQFPTSVDNTITKAVGGIVGGRGGGP